MPGDIFESCALCARHLFFLCRHSHKNNGNVLFWYTFGHNSALNTLHCIFVWRKPSSNKNWMHALSSEINGIRSGMQITRSMLLGGWSRLTCLFPPQRLYLCTSWLFCLFSVSRAAILWLKDVLLVLLVWDLEKFITLPYYYN